MTKKVKSVSFNDKNLKEKEMIKHIGRKNFSKYIKGLISDDMLLKQSKKEDVSINQTTNDDEEETENIHETTKQERSYQQYQQTVKQYYQNPTPAQPILNTRKPPQDKSQRFVNGNSRITE